MRIKIRTAVTVVCALAALSFPVWGPANFASSYPAIRDHICVPTPQPTCLPDVGPSGVPVPAPTGTGVPQPPSGGNGTPLSVCGGAIHGGSAICSFTLSGEGRVMVVGVIGSKDDVAGPGGPVPAPTGVPTPSGVPSVTPPSGVPTLPPVPTVPPVPQPGMHSRSVRNAPIQIDVVNRAGVVLLTCQSDGFLVGACINNGAFPPTGEILTCRAKRQSGGAYACMSF